MRSGTRWALVLGLVVLGLVVAGAVAVGVAGHDQRGPARTAHADHGGRTKDGVREAASQVQAWSLTTAGAYTGGVAEGFGHSELGAVSAANALTAELYTRAADLTALVGVLRQTTTSTSTVIAGFADEMRSWARGEGAGGQATWSASWSPYGCKVLGQASADVVDVALEGTLELPGGGAGTQVVAWPMRWTGQGWRTVAVAEPTPFSAAPPPGEGWHPC
jgi:hypothetical protein